MGSCLAADMELEALVPPCLAEVNLASHLVAEVDAVERLLGPALGAQPIRPNNAEDSWIMDEKGYWSE